MSKNKLLKITEEGKFDFLFNFDEVQKLDWYAFGDFLNELCTEAFLAGLDDAVTIKEKDRFSCIQYALWVSKNIRNKESEGDK